MNEELIKYEAERKKLVSKMKKMILLAVFIGIVGVILCVWLGFYKLSALPIFAGIMIVIASQSGSKATKARFKQEVIANLVKSELGEGATYLPGKGIPLVELMRPDFLKNPDRDTSEDYLSGTYNGVFYESCDCEFKERRTTIDAQGHTHTEYVTYFKGRFIIMDFKRDINFELRVVESKFAGFSLRKFEKVETEVIEFNKKFSILASDKENAFYFLTPSLIQKMLELEKMYRGTIYYAICDGKFYVAINNGADSLEFSLRKEINEEFINIIKGDINLPATIISEFGIDADKFNEDR